MDNHKIKWAGNLPLINKAKGKKIPFKYSEEPLSIECQAFINWLQLNKKPVSDCEEGLRVLKVLELAKEKLRRW